MKSKSHEKTPDFLMLPFSIVFCVCMFLVLSRFLHFTSIANILVISLFFLCASVAHFGTIKYTKLFSVFLLIVSVNILLTCIHPNIIGVRYLLIQVLSYSFLLFLSMGYLSNKYLDKLSLIFNRFCFCFSVLFVVAFLMGKVHMNGDTFAIEIYHYLFTFTYFVLLRAKKMLTMTIWFALIQFLSGDRGLMISLFIVYLIYFFIPLIRKTKGMYILFFWMVSIFSSLFQFIYIWLYKSEWGLIINEMSRKYTEQNFFSGRQSIWIILNDLIVQSPILGYGLGNDLLENAGINMSAHNTYVNILLNGGIISLILFFLFLYYIWKSMYDYLDDKAIRLSMGFLIAVIIFGTNGVIFIGNDISFTLCIWIILGIACMRRNYICKYGY